MQWEKGGWIYVVLYSRAHAAYTEKSENNSKPEASKHSLCYSGISGKSVVTFYTKLSIFCGKSQSNLYLPPLATISCLILLVSP